MPQRVLELVRGVLAGRDGEDLIQLLERQGLGLGHEQQDQHPADQTPRRVPAERALGFERRQQVRPGEGEDEVEAPSDSSTLAARRERIWLVGVKSLTNVVAVAQDIPTSRTWMGNASAEYVNGTGPSPGE